jgi:ABC-type polysaccharide/polyol phosphate export permease
MLSTPRRLLRHRSLLAALTLRELKARYRGSLLGFFWSLVNPLLLLGVYSFVFGFVFRRPWSDTEPYAVFLVSGLFPWIWTSSSLLEGTTSLVGNAGLIRKAVFPIEILPLVPVLANLVHLVFALPIVALALVAGRLLGYPVGGAWGLALPLVIVLQLPMLAGLSLGLAALNVHFKDIRDLLANLLQLLFFLTPILYTVDSISLPLIRGLIRLNPFTPFTVSYQHLLFSGRAPEPVDLGSMLVVSVLAWWLGSALFERLAETIAEAV